MTFIRQVTPLNQGVYAGDNFSVWRQQQTPCEFALELYTGLYPNDPNPPSNEANWESVKATTIANQQDFALDPDRYFVVGSTAQLPNNFLDSFSGSWPVSWPPLNPRTSPGINDVDPFTGDGGIVGELRQNFNGNIRIIAFIVTDRSGALRLNSTGKLITIFQDSGDFAARSNGDATQPTTDGVYDPTLPILVDFNAPSQYVSDSGDALIPVTGISSDVTYDWFVPQDVSIWSPENGSTRFDLCPLQDPPPFGGFLQCPPGYVVSEATAGPIPPTASYSVTRSGSSNASLGFAKFIVLGTATRLAALQAGLPPEDTLFQPVPAGARITSFSVTGSGSYLDTAQSLSLDACPAAGPAVPAYYKGVAAGQVATIDFSNGSQVFYDEFQYPYTIDGSAGPIASAARADVVLTQVGTKENVCSPGDTTDIPTVETLPYAGSLGISPLPPGGVTIDENTVMLLQIAVGPDEVLWSGSFDFNYTISYDNVSFPAVFCLLDPNGGNLPRRRVTVNGQHVRFYNSYALVPPGSVTLPPQTGGPTPV